MTTWDNSDVSSRKLENLTGSRSVTYTIAGISGDTGGTLNCDGFKIVDNYSVYVYYNKGSNTTFTATANGAAGGTTIINAAHTQANDYWNGCSVTMLTGTCAGETQLITDFDAGTDTLVTDAFTAQIDLGDTYRFNNVGYNSALEHYLSSNNIVVAYTNPANTHTVKIKVWGIRG